jgi:hypothetical protein
MTSAQRSRSEFFRFPHTPHVALLGQGKLRDDKLVRASFTQAIEEHWSKRQLEENQLAQGSNTWR